jgi:hypothetical protein
MSAAEKVGVRRARASLAIAAIVTLFGFGAVPAEAASRPTISVLVPIVAADSSTDLLAADELTMLTSPGGSWAQITSAAISHGATIALDSRIVASIAALGQESPPAVSAWLDSVERSRPIYLPWGNADPFVLTSIGPSFRVSTIQLSEISGIPAADIIGWPTGRAGSSRSLRNAEKLGFGRIIADDETFPGLANAYSASASAEIADAVAVGSKTDPIAVATHIRDSANGRLAVVLPRDPASVDGKRVVAFLNALFRGSARGSRFVAAAVTNDTTATFDNVPTGAIQSLMSQHRLDRQVSEMALDPRAITTPRLQRLCVVAGLVASKRFPAATRGYVRTAKTYEEFVSFSLGSDFTVLANSTELPLTVTNDSETDITVIASVNAVSGIVSITKPSQTITIPSGSSARVTVPMVSVANGQTSLRATLTTTDGLAISEPVFVEIDVQAQWEGITLVIFVAIVASIMAIGIARTIRDRRRRS